MAAAQGREMVAGIALPRRPQGGLVPTVMAASGEEDFTINEQRDGSLPAPRPQGYLFSVRATPASRAPRAADCPSCMKARPAALLGLRPPCLPPPPPVKALLLLAHIYLQGCVLC